MLHTVQVVANDIIGDQIFHQTKTVSITVLFVAARRKCEVVIGVGRVGEIEVHWHSPNTGHNVQFSAGGCSARER